MKMGMLKNRVTNISVNDTDILDIEQFSNNSVIWKEKYEETRKILKSYNLFSDHLINYSIDFYFNKLGLNKCHFEETSSEIISKVVVCIITAKINEQYSSDKYFPIFEEKRDNIIYIICRVYNENSKTRLNYKMEKRIEEKYFNFSDMSKNCYRLKSFRSMHSVFDKEQSCQEPLRTYILELPNYSDDIISENENDLSKLMDISFYNSIKNTKNEKIYYELNKAVLHDLTGQFIQVHYMETSKKTFTLNIAVKRSNVIPSIFSLTGDCLSMHRCFSYSKYVEPLKNGVLIIILNVMVIEDEEKNDINLKKKIHKIVKSIKTLCLFHNPQLIQLSVKRIFTSEEAAYIYIMIKFITFFSANPYPSYRNVENALSINNGDKGISALNDFYVIKEKLKSSKYTENEILQCVQSNVKVVKLLFSNFEIKVRKNENSSLSYESECGQYRNSKDIIDEIEDNHHKKILYHFYMFEKYVVKTNFFLIHKTSFAISFDGSLLKDSFYETQPYSIIMVLGLNFSGFHIRFSRISRGGIRIVISNNMNSYRHNFDNLFDEVYNLSYTQNFKNKDIPEGGSKGIILLKPDVCNQPNTKYIKNLCFYSYVNSILDLLINTNDESTASTSVSFSKEINDLPNGINKMDKIKEKVVESVEKCNKKEDNDDNNNNYYNKKEKDMHMNKFFCNMNHKKGNTEIFTVDENDKLPENINEDLIFLGPDENTGSDQLMDWAAIMAKKRKYKYWKTFSTGKLRKNGGVPHDLYGMTTLGIETYIRKLCEKLNLKEEEISRSLIGGPDGDLGSNAILQSKTKIISIIDGSGVLYDKNGLNKKELVRLAKMRNSMKNGATTSCILYDEKYLSKDGFKISIEEYNVEIFGKTIKNGLDFRNTFFLNALNKCDLFNPCGGRPHSINVFNVNDIIKDNECIYKYIIEGANVFISDDARKILENKNVVLFKDASTNKGGVISSSLEVLAGLVLDDDQYIQLMCCKDNDLLLLENDELTFVGQNQRRNHYPSFNRAMLIKHRKSTEEANESNGGDDNSASMSKQDDEDISTFYKEYVQDIQNKIKYYCELEFESLWKETRRTKTPICQATNILSKKINELKKDILESDTLCYDYKLVKNVLEDIIPPTLLKVVTFDQIFERVPYVYLKFLFASSLASKYYYSHSFLDNLSAFSFFEYIRNLQNES